MMPEPLTRAGRWLLERTRWDDGMRGFFVRINMTGSPDDMHRHILAIENEASRAALEGLRAEMAAHQSWRIDRTYILSIIDARLAALP